MLYNRTTINVLSLTHTRALPLPLFLLSTFRLVLDVYDYDLHTHTHTHTWLDVLFGFTGGRRVWNGPSKASRTGYNCTDVCVQV